MKKWYLLNIWLLIATIAWGQNIEFDTLNVPQYSETDEFYINSSGYIFTDSRFKNYSEDGGATWSFPEWGQPKTTIESESFFGGGYKYNLEDFSVDTFPQFLSVARGAQKDIKTDGIGNTFASSNRDEIYIVPEGEKEWKLLHSYWHLHRGTDLLESFQVFKSSDYLFHTYDGTNFRSNKFDGSDLTTIDYLPQYFHPSGKFIAIENENYFYSEDEGLTWSPFSNLPINSSSITFFDCDPSGRMIILNQDSLIFISEDFGQNWSSQSIDIPELEFDYHGASSSPMMRYNEKRNEYLLITPANFNTNFFSISSDFQLFNPIYSDPTTHVVAGVTDDFSKNIYIYTYPFSKMPSTFRSVDNGKTFEPYPVNGVKYGKTIVPLRKSPIVLASIHGREGIILRSNDSGDTWEELSVLGSDIQVGYDDQIAFTDLDGIKHVSYDNGDT